MIIEAKDFAGQTSTGHSFGVPLREKTIEGLLKIIAAIADGRALVQSVRVAADVNVADYLMHAFTLVFAERAAPLPQEGQISGEKLRELFRNCESGGAIRPRGAQYTAECRHSFGDAPCCYIGEDDKTIETCLSKFKMWGVGW